VSDVYPSAESLLSDDGNFVAADSRRIGMADTVSGIPRAKIPAGTDKNALTVRIFVADLICGEK